MKHPKNRMKQGILFLSFFILGSAFILSSVGEKRDDEHPDGCTTITVGRLASSDGSVITSHTCDSHRTRSSVTIAPRQKHKSGSMTDVHKRENDDSTPMPRYKRMRVGEIPQVEETYGFINTAYPCMNEHQLAVGESTFGGREELHSENGLIDCPELCRILMERCSTAREAIQLAGELIAQFGWNDEGECLTFADSREVWHLEIVGPGKGKRGGIWAAQRVPDDHVSVNANASRIRQIDLSKPDYFMASENVLSVAEENGWWDPNSGEPFEFCYAYNPEGRTSFASRRREWRVLDLVAPSLKLHPNDENYPFSVKPDEPITMEQLMTIFRDWFEGTEFDMTKNITVTDDDGKTVKSPLANPFMPYDMNPLFSINGGWGWRGERPIARWYCMYVIITQSRDWLPDPIGGVVWYGLDNPATTAYVPLYCSITDLPEPYKTCGRITGYSRDCAWWVFNRVGTLAAQRWGDMRKDVRAVWEPFQKEILAKQSTFEAEALALHKTHPERASEPLTQYTNGLCNRILKAYLNLGDLLWTKYDEKW